MNGETSLARIFAPASMTKPAAGSGAHDGRRDHAAPRPRGLRPARHACWRSPKTYVPGRSSVTAPCADSAAVGVEPALRTTGSMPSAASDVRGAARPGDLVVRRGHALRATRVAVAPVGEDPRDRAAQVRARARERPGLVRAGRPSARRPSRPRSGRRRVGAHRRTAAASASSPATESAPTDNAHRSASRRSRSAFGPGAITG